MTKEIRSQNDLSLFDCQAWLILLVFCCVVSVSFGISKGVVSSKGKTNMQVGDIRTLGRLILISLNLYLHDCFPLIGYQIGTVYKISANHLTITEASRKLNQMNPYS